jgi:hypothetical protein
MRTHMFWSRKSLGETYACGGKGEFLQMFQIENAYNACLYRSHTIATIETIQLHRSVYIRSWNVGENVVTDDEVPSRVWSDLPVRVFQPECASSQRAISSWHALVHQLNKISTHALHPSVSELFVIDHAWGSGYCSGNQKKTTDTCVCARCGIWTASPMIHGSRRCAIACMPFVCVLKFSVHSRECAQNVCWPISDTTLLTHAHTHTHSTYNQSVYQRSAVTLQRHWTDG